MWGLFPFYMGKYPHCSGETPPLEWGNTPIVMGFTLCITINKTVSMPSTKAQIYSSSQYLIRMAIMAVVLFVSAKAPHLNIVGTAIGLLSTKFVILTQKLLIEKVKRKEA